MLKEFREFVARGNVVDLAVGIILGAAFGRIVTALVEGVLMPPIGLALGGVDFASLFWVLGDAPRPASLAAAKEAGVPVIAYGALINEMVSFLIVALAVFFIVRAVNRIKSRPAAADAPTTKECPFCLSTIPKAATRCAHCTSELRAA